MSIKLLGYVYIGLSVGLFVWCLRSRRAFLNGFSYAIALDTLPLLPFGYLTSELTRFGRVPIAYFPFIAVISAGLLVSRLRFPQRWADLYGVWVGLLAYLLVQSLAIVKIKHYESFLQYYAMWVLNPLTMFLTAAVSSRLERRDRIYALSRLVWVVVLCSLVGIGKYFLGISNDANFIAIFNRNGTAFLLVLLVPAVFMLRDLGVLSLLGFTAIAGVMLTTLLLIRSRMGLLGLIFAVSSYNFAALRGRLLKSLAFLACVLLVGASVSLLPWGQVAFARLGTTAATVSDLLSRHSLAPNQADYVRVELLRYSLQVALRSPLFGTGVGLDNYVEMLRTVVPNPIREAKPHNLYTSYLSEFGLVGFALLMVLFWRIWRSLGNQSDRIASNCFRSVLLTVMFMFTMNEYVTFPFMWFVLGVGLALADRRPPVSRVKGEQQTNG